MGALEFDFWGWGRESDRRGHPTFAFGSPPTELSFFPPVLPNHLSPRYIFYLSLASPTSECPWDICTRQFLPGTGEEKSRMRHLLECSLRIAPFLNHCFKVEQIYDVVSSSILGELPSLIVRDGARPPCRRFASPRFHAFFAGMTLWHVFQPFPFPLPLCTASLFYIPLPPSSLSFQPRSAAEEAFAFVPFKAMLPPQQRTIARSFAPPLPLPSSY